MPRIKLTGAEKALRDVGDDVVSKIKENLVAYKINATGNLSKSVKKHVGGRGGSLFLRIDAAYYWESGGGDGTAPGKIRASVSKLEAWARKKASVYGLDFGPTYKALAIQIKSSIHRQGSYKYRKPDGKHAFNDVYNDLIGGRMRLRDRVTDGVRNDIQTDINARIKSLFKIN